MLQEIVRGKLDLLMSPFGGPVDACDEGRPVHPPEVAEHERISGLGLISHACGEAEMPGGVLLPGMPFQKGILGIRARLHLSQSLLSTYCLASISRRQLRTAASFSAYFAMSCRLSVSR
jgi:hypothetical protein